jgi:hypothetical protein
MNPTTDDALGTRHATLQDLAALLRGQKTHKVTSSPPPPPSAPSTDCSC